MSVEETSQKLYGITQPLTGLVTTMAWFVMMRMLKWYLMQSVQAEIMHILHSVLPLFRCLS